MRKSYSCFVIDLEQIMKENLERFGVACGIRVLRADVQVYAGKVRDAANP